MILVEAGRQAIRGSPLQVHLNGLAIVRLKYLMKSDMVLLSSSLERKFPLFSTLRERMLNQISTWFSHDACVGVK